MDIKFNRTSGLCKFWIGNFYTIKLLFIELRSALLAMHIAYESILTKSLQNESVGFFILMVRASVETKMARRLCEML